MKDPKKRIVIAENGESRNDGPGVLNRMSGWSPPCQGGQDGHLPSRKTTSNPVPCDMVGIHASSGVIPHATDLNVGQEKKDRSFW